MEEKYKLIKKYPESPELGTIAEKYYSNSSIKYTDPKKGLFYKCSNSANYFETTIKNQPEFWEKVVEKEYEILSFYSVDRRYIYDLQSDGSYKTRVPHGHCFSSENFINCPIHSVKRLSDGEIFTIGDRIKGYIGDQKPFILTDIWFNEVGKLTFANYSKNSKGSRSSYLGWISKVRIPLFTTEDGVDIYEGDYVCWIGNVKYTDIKINDYRLADKTMITDGSILYFSTKEAAEEYILMDKPCLSINDVLGAGYGICCSEPLKNIVKNKLKNEKEI